MDVKKYWFGSRSQRTQNIRLGRSYTKPYRSYSPSSYDGTKTTVWKMLWRKLKRSSDHKKKVFSSHTTMEGVYDQETYSMNFDQGTGWMEPENLPRSFSARFAYPSRILPPKHLLS
ncbi:hypothetical protein AAZX31_06G077400 [Glycine max]|uniref:Uncharacterized protein n=2 Tax=Glycine subgen. Soja TaxID=1462606 RepID=K7KTT3_SOYBN|nr:uncharacterized protein LOC100782996 [Glycine max]XP_028234312.1 uncharacterized protein LOC114414196 [Glycine soja]KAH1124735.1 hypothetical protein GYH30_014430 [Glycine max]KAH1244948.1 hypothetical protein GmHk_06G015417 [Glycine max]KHN18211.1 hypothetical protein glysoja_025101 [Glycine soja]KRH52652.1 hypothetical protein GLYMA_06G080800v4 [Glycine max]RZC06378.1 hypothetical protein D0Y65_014077 [Glycine soja]|eukprot:XP_003526470.1 uncharacterized protein LOC100782996 [Glycine max]